MGIGWERHMEEQGKEDEKKKKKTTKEGVEKNKSVCTNLGSRVRRWKVAMEEPGDSQVSGEEEEGTGGKGSEGENVSLQGLWAATDEKGQAAVQA